MREIERIEKYLFDPANRIGVELTNEWRNAFDEVAGAYVLFDERENPVYAGETSGFRAQGSAGLRGRMKDMMNTRHHTVRRTIGQMHFST